LPRLPTPTLFPYTTLFRSSGGITVGHCLHEPWWFFSAPGIAQEMEYVHQPGPGDDTLIAHVPEARVQIPEQIDLQLVARSKISVDRKSTRLNSSHVKISYA